MTPELFETYVLVMKRTGVQVLKIEGTEIVLGPGQLQTPQPTLRAVPTQVGGRPVPGPRQRRSPTHEETLFAATEGYPEDVDA